MYVALIITKPFRKDGFIIPMYFLTLEKQQVIFWINLLLIVTGCCTMPSNLRHSQSLFIQINQNAEGSITSCTWMFSCFWCSILHFLLICLIYVHPVYSKRPFKIPSINCLILSWVLKIAKAPLVSIGHQLRSIRLCAKNLSSFLESGFMLCAYLLVHTIPSE